MSLVHDLEKKKADPRLIAEKSLKDENLLSDVLEGVSSDKPSIKYGCAKALRIIAERSPEALYPRWNFFISLMNSENTFLKSDAIFVIGHLVNVDSENKFERVFDEFYRLLDDESMITAANLVGVSGIIAKAKPKLRTGITNKLLTIDQTHHGSECRNVLKGHIIAALDTYFNGSKEKKKILDFVRKETGNTRPSTRKKAEKFLEKWQQERKR